MSYKEKVWGRERKDHKYYHVPTRIDETFVLKWAKAKMFQCITGKGIPEEYMIIENYNHLIRSMTIRRWRQFVLTMRSKMGLKKCKQFIDHVLSDVICLQFRLKDSMINMASCGNKYLRYADVKPDGCNVYGHNRIRGIAKDTLFVLHEEENFTPINVDVKSYVKWLIFLAQSPYAEEIWPNIGSYRQDLRLMYKLAIKNKCPYNWVPDDSDDSEYSDPEEIDEIDGMA